MLSRRAGLSATAGLSCPIHFKLSESHRIVSYLTLIFLVRPIHLLYRLAYIRPCQILLRNVGLNGAFVGLTSLGLSNLDDAGNRDRNKTR